MIGDKHKYSLIPKKVMGVSKTFLLFGLALVFLLASPSFASAVVNVDELTVYLRPKDGGGELLPLTNFAYEFVFSNSNTCSPQVFSENASVFTDRYGLGVYTLDLSSLVGSAPPAYLCEYRDGSLRAVHSLNPNLLQDLEADTIAWANITGVPGLSNFTNDAGFLTNYTETDPLFVASPSANITNTQISNWNTAYGWGDHAIAGYLTSFTETDPVFVASPSFSITNTQISNWDAAFAWGDHGAEGYLTNYTETDPLFIASPAAGINNSQITNWNTAYGWGDHATAGYLLSALLNTDGAFLSDDGTTIFFDEALLNATIDARNTDTTYSNLSEFFNDVGYLTSFTETDPVFTGSVAFTINQTLLDDWNEAYGWGDHNLEGYLTSFTETDPLFTAANNTLARVGSCPSGFVIQNSTINGVECLDISSVVSGGLISTSSSYLSDDGNTIFFNETLLNQTIIALDTDTTYSNLSEFFNDVGFIDTETDPLFTNSPSFNINNSDINNWNEAYGWGDHALAGYLSNFTESDPLFTSSPASGVSSTQISNWDIAFSWGDHGIVGYVENETDPVFVASAAYNINQSLIDDWNTAYGWGDHALSGYLTSFTETDPVFIASPSFAITNSNISDWNTAFSWGDHALEGYLTSFTETDPVFVASPSFNIGITNISDWNEAYGWGDHAIAGYLTSFTETDPVFVASPSFAITNTNISDWNTAFSWGDHALEGYLTSFTETDPVFTASVASDIESTNITNWNTAFSWGDHALEGYLTSFTETDPVFVASPSFNIGITNISDWNTAFSWGDHSLEGYLTSFTETDPVFVASPSFNIGITNISDWNEAYSWGDHALGGYLTSALTATSGSYLSDDGNTISFNEATLNATIDARNTDTTYTAGNGLLLSGTEFALNTTFTDARYYQEDDNAQLTTLSVGGNVTITDADSCFVLPNGGSMCAGIKNGKPCTIISSPSGGSTVEVCD